MFSFRKLQPKNVPFSAKAVIKQIHFPAVWLCQGRNTWSCLFNKDSSFVENEMCCLIFIYGVICVCIYFYFCMCIIFENCICICRSYWKRTGLTFILWFCCQLWLMLLISLCSLYDNCYNKKVWVVRLSQLDDLSLVYYIGEWALDLCPRW